MDKNVYETYEFLQTNNPEPDADQFFVLQDDGTILTVQKEVQFVTQTEEPDVNTLNPSDSSNMFATPPQQYYVEFEGNTPELISLSDQYSLGNEENNMYGNSYLMQSETSGTQVMETDAMIDPQKLDAQQIQQLNIEAYNGLGQNTNMSEITLSDEQYHMLEQKGWLLLEANNKVFVLNTLGLHDITSNDKLVQRLRSELLENHASLEQYGENKSYMNNDGTVAKNPDNAVDYFINDRLPMEPADGRQQLDQMDERMNVDEPNISAEVSLPGFLNNLNDKRDWAKRCDAVKIKTEYNFTDIPDKIFLGKMATGKNLYAKVKMKVNSQASIANPLQTNTPVEKKTYEGSVLDAATFMNIIQTWIRRGQASDAASVSFADAVIMQLVRLPNLTDCIVRGNLVITKIITTHTAAGRGTEQPTVVTGFIEEQDNDYVFTHSPNMIRDMIQEIEDKQAKEPSSYSAEKPAKSQIELFHINISESRYTDKPPETAIHLSKRKIPIDPLKDVKKRHPNPAFACAICGSIFLSEQLLKNHQDDECIEVEDGLTIDYAVDTSDQTALYTVTNSGKENIYTCALCNTKFTRLFNCKKHIKAHQEGKEKRRQVYKCKMCSNTYYHSSTLSKHIVRTHLQGKLNT